MTLYIWRGVLKEYGEGFAFALAPNIEEARKMVLDKLREYYDFLIDIDEDIEEHKDIIKVRDSEPDQIIETQYVELVRGSE
jgi:hypothetical protein